MTSIPWSYLYTESQTEDLIEIRVKWQSYPRLGGGSKVGEGLGKVDL